MTDDVATRVARGVALLDEHKPGWVGLIDLARFNIAYTDKCVLGQVYHQDEDQYFNSGFGQGSEELGILCNEGEYGFDNVIDNDSGLYVKDDFPELQAEWVRVIRVLRQQRIDQESYTDTEVSVAEPKEDTHV